MGGGSLPALMSNQPKTSGQDEILTSPGDAAYLDPFEDGHVTTTHTLVVENRTTLKVRKCRLAVTGGPDTGKEVVSDKERLRVGAHSTNDLVLVEDRTASRHHFEIQYTERGYLVIDLNSTNGTWLDGRRIERAYLSQGSQIRAGQTTLSFAPIDEEVTVEPDRDGELCGMIGQSVKMRQIFGLIKKIAPMDVSVIIQGETGTGKELVARAIHELSGRKRGPMVVLDCGAIPPNLIESELFGHEKGAFTGAIGSRPGAFERANGGTIFLDELGELRTDLQPKLLRVLENREVRRVGGNEVQRDRRARHRRHQPRPGQGDPDRELPRRPLLPPLGHQHSAAAAAPAPRRHSPHHPQGAGRPGDRRPPREEDRLGARDERADAVLVARQHSRADERDQPRAHLQRERAHRPAAPARRACRASTRNSRCPSTSTSRSRTPRSSCSRTSSASTSARCSSAVTATSAVRRASRGCTASPSSGW